MAKKTLVAKCPKWLEKQPEWKLLLSLLGPASVIARMSLMVLGCDFTHSRPLGFICLHAAMVADGTTLWVNTEGGGATPEKHDVCF